jgi:hypothetical protein
LVGTVRAPFNIIRTTASSDRDCVTELLASVPAYECKPSDGAIAAVDTYARSWENAAAPVLASDVASMCRDLGAHRFFNKAEAIAMHRHPLHLETSFINLFGPLERPVGDGELTASVDVPGSSTQISVGRP